LKGIDSLVKAFHIFPQPAIDVPVSESLDFLGQPPHKRLKVCDALVTATDRLRDCFIRREYARRLGHGYLLID
jgi:hypothetical protein